MEDQRDAKKGNKEGEPKRKLVDQGKAKGGPIKGDQSIGEPKEGLKGVQKGPGGMMVFMRNQGVRGGSRGWRRVKKCNQ